VAYAPRRRSGGLDRRLDRALVPTTTCSPTYRCHGYPIVLGTDPKALMAEIYGRETGICKGYGGSMHLTDVERGFLGTSGIVGQGIPHATGAAWAAQIRGKGQVVLSFFGDGAAKQGAFHESLNIASLWKLPIVFVMENNNYQAYTKVEQEDERGRGRAVR
jgi:pyruvate dehydrogenase E1 component alpha subunit